MKKSLQILLLSILPGLSHAQSIPDSISVRVKAVDAKSNKILDSINSLASINLFRDSLTIQTWSDNLQSRINHRFSTDALSRYGDSLRRFGVPEHEVLRRSDSLFQRKISLLKEVQEKQSNLQTRISRRYTAWTETARKKFNLDSAGVRLPDATLPVNSQGVPSPGLPPRPGTDLPVLPPIPALGMEDFSSLGASPELATVGGGITVPTAPQLSDWQKSLPSLQDHVAELNKQVGGLKELAADPSDAAGKAATQIAEVSDATTQLKSAEELKKQADALKATEQLNNPEAIKAQAANHFAGKEAELQTAMNQTAKYKKKYASIGSLSEIPKNDWLPRNGLKGKPFKERFRPGMNLGVRSNSDTVLIDIYPTASYRITGRLEAGLGGIYRLRVSTNPFNFDQKDPVWGFAFFTVVKTFKSVFIRIETDATSHAKSGNAELPAYRDWRWSFYTGVQTNFKISKRLLGNVQMLYNFDSNLKDGFPEKLTARVGIQYKLKM